MTEAPGGLRVLVDGQPMPEEEARAFWQRFSEHMETNRGDLAGFAKAEGYASVHPGLGADGPELHVSRSATQRPYSNVSKGGSPKAQPQGPSRPPGGRRSR
ncbi:MAG TPA: hypothetical protein VF316_24440 [Polyangiaceae bacterium]